MKESQKSFGELPCSTEKFNKEQSVRGRAPDRTKCMNPRPGSYPFPGEVKDEEKTFLPVQVTALKLLGALSGGSFALKKKKKYFAAPGLGCSMWDLGP